jgi:hypothetical protein
MTCTSTNNQRNYCRVNNSGVRVNRRLSEANCDQNSSWGYDNQGIWVDRGCSAEFVVDTYNNGNANNGGYNNQGSYNNGTYNNGSYNNQGTYNNGSSNNGQTVRCTARNRGNDHTYCQADTSRGVQLVNQVSGTCTQNSTWGYDSNGIWVSRGCSADFQLGNSNNRYGYGRRRDRGNSGNAYNIRCDSTNNNSQQNYCAADARGGVHLVREYSNNICRQGSTWGYDSSGVWVSNGCSADFEVDSYGNTSGYYSGRTTTIPSGTKVSIRADEAIDSKNAYAGQRYAADVANDVTDSNGTVIIPRGSQAELILHTADNQNYNPNNNTNNNQNLVIDLDSVTVNGQRYIVSTSDVTSTGSGIGANKKTGEYVGGGALLGAIIGAVAGGGKGAAIGAGVGAAAGAGGVVLTKGKDIKVPVETVLNFKLDQDLQLQAVR